MEYLSADRPWYKGNLHMHTTLSDGRLSPEEAKARYRGLGYDFIAVTDHRRLGEGTHFFDGMLVLPGIELDYDLVGQVLHLVGIGLKGGPDPQALIRMGPQRAVDAIRALGGEAVLAHPAWSLNTPEVICGLRRLLAAEVYNGIAAPPFSGDRADSLPLLDVAAAAGCLLNTVAADDSHYYDGEEGTAFIRVQADALSEEAVMAALRQGRYHASCGPEFHSLRLEGDQLLLTCSPVEHIVFLSDLPWAPSRNLTGEGLTEGSYRLSREGQPPVSFLRVVLIDAQGRRAWANPIRL